MAKMKIVDLLYNQKKEVELGEVTGTDPIPVESPVEFGSDIEVDGKVKVNSKEDFTDKDGNPIDFGGGSGGGTKFYKHTFADLTKRLELITTFSAPIDPAFGFYIPNVISAEVENDGEYSRVILLIYSGDPSEGQVHVVYFNDVGQKSTMQLNAFDVVTEL